MNKGYYENRDKTWSFAPLALLTIDSICKEKPPE